MSPGPDPSAVDLVQRLARLGDTLAISESLTGGLIGAAITTVPGASAVYLGGVVVYATELKARLSGVPDEVLAEYGAVSEQTVLAMAAGISGLVGSDWGLAVTGVAGPAEQEGHPPGTVWIGVVGPGTQTGVLHRFAGDRAAVRAQTVAAGLALLQANMPASGGALPW